MKKDTIIAIATWAVILIVIIGAFSFYVIKNNNGSSTKYDDFAKCLTTKGVTMYGAVWCSHCKAQKEMFGTSFQYVKYVECTENTNLCLDKGVNAYPSWIFADGKKIEGEVSFDELSKVTGCELPK